MLVEHRHASSDPATMSIVRQSEAALDAGRPSDAERIARLAIGRDAQYVPARLALGRALEALGRHAEAATVYAEAARISPFSAGVSTSLRRVWIAPLAGFGVVAILIWGVFRVIQRRFDEHTVLFGLLVSVAVLALGTLVLLHRRRRRFASLTAEDRRLMERQGAWALLSGPGSGRLLAVALVILLLSGAAVVFAVGTKPSLGMKVGDCFTLDRHTSIQQVSAIPCALPHGTEVYAVVENPAPLDAPYPGVDAVRAYANPTCEAAYEAFVGVPYSPSSRLWISILSPEEPYWVIGVRTTWCSLQARDGGQTTGSALGSGD
jgi:hypothetical protein